MVTAQKTSSCGRGFSPWGTARGFSNWCKPQAHVVMPSHATYEIPSLVLPSKADCEFSERQSLKGHWPQEATESTKPLMRSKRKSRSASYVADWTGEGVLVWKS